MVPLLGILVLTVAAATALAQDVPAREPAIVVTPEIVVVGEVIGGSFAVMDVLKVPGKTDRAARQASCPSHLTPDGYGGCILVIPGSDIVAPPNPVPDISYCVEPIIMLPTGECVTIVYPVPGPYDLTVPGVDPADPPQPAGPEILTAP
jgi:hypothetical protein